MPLRLGFLLCYVLASLTALEPGATAVGQVKTLSLGGAEAPLLPRAVSDWPGWRGPNGDGVQATELPVRQWTASAGVLWKVAVPGRGHASPIIQGDQVLVSSADEQDGQARGLYCYHRTTGALLWGTVFHRGGYMTKHANNTHASPTPACAGGQVYLPWLGDGALWLSAFDLKGGKLWKCRLGPFVPEHGYASSPVVYKDLVIVSGDNRGTPDAADSSYLVAVQRQTGQVAWRVNRPLAPNYGTPVVARLAGRDQLLLSGAERVCAYDPATGQELWFCRWSAQRAASSVAFGDDCVFASVTWYESETVCVRADGSGDVTASHVRWRQRRGATDVPAPLYHVGRLYLIGDKGVATCLEGATGKVLWQERLGGAHSASPVRAGDCILTTDEGGTTYLFKAAAKFELLGQNSLNDTVMASPALSGDRLYLRSQRFLWCLDGQTKGAVALTPAPSRVVVSKAEVLPPVPAPSLPAPSRRGMLLGIAVSTLLVIVAMFWFAVRLGRRPETSAASPALMEGPVPNHQPSAPLAVQCLACGKKLKARAELAGKKVKCPQCGEAVRLPRPREA
jgi:outer membrane protein assembly factor BamB